MKPGDLAKIKGRFLAGNYVIILKVDPHWQVKPVWVCLLDGKEVSFFEDELEYV